MSTAYGYLRVSPKGVGSPALSLENQQERILRVYDFKLKPRGVAWGAFVEDPHVSARLPFASRPGGARLGVALREGDHVLMAKLDRGFRQVQDLCATMQEWERRKIVFHFLDLDVDTGTPVGRLLVQFLGVVAEFERGRMSERVRESAALRRQAGLPVSGPAPYPFKYEGAPGAKRLAVDEDMLRLGRAVAEWRALRHPWGAIVAHARALGLTVRGRQPTRHNLQRVHDDELARRRREAARAQEGRREEG